MTVTAKIFKINGEKIKASASVTIDDAIVINDILVKEKKEGGGLYLQFPTRSYKDKDGNAKRKDIAFPITSEARATITNAVLDEYAKA